MRLAWSVCVLVILASVVLDGARCFAQRPPHVPTEEELTERNKPREDETTARRGQARAVESTQDKARGAVEWVRSTLSGLKITPPRLALALGLLGAIYTWPKNKRLTHWMIVAGLSYVLLLVGVIGLLVR